jgi:hypothetical protein
LTAINFCRSARRVYFYWMTKRAHVPRVGSTYVRRGLRDVWDWELSTKENAMRMQLRASALVLALLGGIGLAAGQGMPGDAGAQEKLNLSKSKEDTISQGLKSEPARRGRLQASGVIDAETVTQ